MPLTLSTLPQPDNTELPRVREARRRPPRARRPAGARRGWQWPRAFLPNFATILRRREFRAARRRR
jgi:hypothetical protein